jgi:hypothetical protein
VLEALGITKSLTKRRFRETHDLPRGREMRNSAIAVPTLCSKMEQFPATKLGTVFGTVYRRMHSKTGHGQAPRQTLEFGNRFEGLRTVNAVS